MAFARETAAARPVQRTARGGRRPPAAPTAAGPIAALQRAAGNAAVAARLAEPCGAHEECRCGCEADPAPARIARLRTPGAVLQRAECPDGVDWYTTTQAQVAQSIRGLTHMTMSAPIAHVVACAFCRAMV